MLLTMALILAIVSSLIEIKLVKSLPWLRHIMVNGLNLGFFTVPSSFLNIAFSLGLSIVTGMVFGAAGLVVMFAGVLSTVATQPYYKYETQIDKFFVDCKIYFNKGIAMVPAIIAWLKVQQTNIQDAYTRHQLRKEKVQKLINDFRQPVADFLTLVLIVLKVITLPIQAARAASVAYTNNRNAVVTKIDARKARYNAMAAKYKTAA